MCMQNYIFVTTCLCKTGIEFHNCGAPSLKPSLVSYNLLNLFILSAFTASSLSVFHVSTTQALLKYFLASFVI